MTRASRTRTCVLWSGGKDCFAALLLDAEARGGGLSTYRLLTLGPERPRFRCHPLVMMERQARHLGVEHRTAVIDPDRWRDSYRARFEELAADGVETIVTGDLRREGWLVELTGACGLDLRLPLHGLGHPAAPLDEIERLGIGATVAGVRSEFDRPGFLGGRISRGLLERVGLMPPAIAGFDPCGEGGEYHTVVTRFRGRDLLGADPAGLGRTEADGIVSLDLAPALARAGPARTPASPTG